MSSVIEICRQSSDEQILLIKKETVSDVNILILMYHNMVNVCKNVCKMMDLICNAVICHAD